MPARTQEAPQDPAKTFNIDFPDSTSGLEKLARELFKSIQHEDSDRANALTQSLILQNPHSWYARVFGDLTAANEGADYIKSRAALPKQLQAAFAQNLKDHYSDVYAVRFENSCDDNAADTTFGMLQSRLEPVPLYELRMAYGTQFRRIFPFVYQDGAFRYVYLPKTPPAPPPLRFLAPADGASTPPAPSISRVRQGGTVQAAKLLKKVQPEYPPKAMEERLQGTVRLHAIIGTDGSITHLRVLTGKCSLADSALKAVQQWRYSPTLFNGNPVEVDTTIDVIYSLNR